MTMLGMIHHPSPIGTLTLVTSEVGLRAVLWPDEDGARVHLEATEPADDHPTLRSAADQLDRYFAGSLTLFDVPLDPVGTDFQKAAWAVLRTIPYGQTYSYGEEAAEMGRPTAARAVGAANGANPLSIIVPCHRVVSATGALTGFAGGLDVKARLLDHEREIAGRGAPAGPGR